MGEEILSREPPEYEELEWRNARKDTRENVYCKGKMPGLVRRTAPEYRGYLMGHGPESR